VKHTKAPPAKVMDYYMHPENLPKVHPDFFKEAKVLSTEGNSLVVEETMEMMGRKLHAKNRMTRIDAEKRVEVDTLEGDGKGSKITIALKEIPTGTEIHYFAEMEFGAVGFLIKGRAKASFEKTAEEDRVALDAS